ncbi:hypothetical protein LINPERHAP1_LOCUS18058 [Linum perenne]
MLVEEYSQVMEILVTRLDLSEDVDAKIARFNGGLRREILHQVNILNFVDYDDFVTTAIRVEKELKNGLGRRATTPPPISAPVRGDRSAEHTPYRPNPSRNSGPRPNPNQGSASRVTPNPNSKIPTTNARPSAIVCFKCQGRGHMARECPNTRAMVLREGEVVTDDEEEPIIEEIEEESSEGEEVDTEGLEKILAFNSRVITPVTLTDAEQHSPGPAPALPRHSAPHCPGTAPSPARTSCPRRIMSIGPPRVF